MAKDIRLKNGGWVVVANGEKARFLRNNGDEVHPNLSVFKKEAQENPPITAKTFRTWAGSLAAFDLARRMVADGERPTIKSMSEEAAATLFNTPSICRSSYIHPAIIELADKDVPINENLFGEVSVFEKGLIKAEGHLLEFLKFS